MTETSIELEIDLEVRITKYNPNLRDGNGAFRGNDWTSVSDIGKFSGLTTAVYLDVENKFWNVLLSMLTDLSISQFEIDGLEDRGLEASDGKNPLIAESINACRKIGVRNHMQVGLDEFQALFRAAMREVVWFRAKGDHDTFVHFGYDYYLYFGSKRNFYWKAIDGIFVENFIAPRHLALDDD